MPHFGRSSKKKLATCDKRLQDICNEAIKYYDFSVICGYRGEKDQNEAFLRGASKAKFPQSEHNKSPSRAVDLAPYPIDWRDRERFRFLSYIIRGIADYQGVKLRWGGDFESVSDMPHFEIVE